ncbi:site-specific integrase [Nonomuraea sp. NPDC050786]|uniref:site-specific integrase n=1 Tax=Nonomuraea sp. NPDC050786 TaxID=3154840 RepID=UPI0033D0FE92
MGIRKIGMPDVARGRLRRRHAAGEPLIFSPHDFRRIFVTDAIMNGLPPHIAQVICGHKSLDTTMGYKAIYPAETIDAHRAFIARRRAPVATARPPAARPSTSHIAENGGPQRLRGHRHRTPRDRRLPHPLHRLALGRQIQRPDRHPHRRPREDRETPIPARGVTCAGSFNSDHLHESPVD